MEKNTDGGIHLAGNNLNSEGSGYAQELNRTLKTKDLIIFGLIIMLPIAPVQIYQWVASASFGMPTLIYLVGIVTMFFTAYSYAKMSSEFPVAGSAYTFVQRGLNPHVGFVIGWLITLDYVLAPAVLIGLAASWISGGIFTTVPSWIWVIVIVFFNSFINIIGIKIAAFTNKAMLIIELTAIALFVFFSVKYVVLNDLGFTIAPIYQPGKIDFQFIASATAVAVFGFIGFDTIATLSEEVKNPKKTVGKAIILALLIIGVLFVVQSYMAALVHPNYKDLDPAMAFFDIARQCGGTFLYMFLLVVAVIAVGIANALAVQTGVSRLLYSMSRDKMLPASGFLCKIHPKFQTPVNSVVFVGIVTLLLAFVPVTVLLMLINFGALTTYAFMNLTTLNYFYFRKKERGLSGFFKNLIIPVLGFLILGYVWLGLGKLTFIVGFSWCALGAIVGFVKSKGYKEVPPVLRDL